ncbi:hypothetical protein [Salinibacter altiplanensis]|uniref:hypothetical protein n=1 Tax=Salinibacter altiplanensis TaxID=1803181 RepID=UPI000C9F19E0|nr:hypothetical protein [Salinibacter altiplanensis]
MEAPDPSDALITPSLRAFLHEVVDYAGLFPPADLSLHRAFQNHAEYRHEEEAWMLSRFVLPVRRLPDLTTNRPLLKEGAPYDLSVLGTGGDTVDAFRAAFERDLEAIEAFDEAHAEQAKVDVMEVSLPDALVGGSQAEGIDFLESITRTLVATGTAKLDLFFEVPLRRDAVASLPALCAAVAEHNSQQAVPARTVVGLKMRFGGAEPTDVPDVEEVAALIVACRDAGIPFKATAGLHHPVRHYDDGLDTKMHGFLNVFGAAVLAAEHALDPPEVQAILREETADNFRFLKDAFAWRDLTVSIDDIQYARENLALSFGSCSFEEPVDHLRDLEWL